jgi:hypothetical protein
MSEREVGYIPFAKAREVRESWKRAREQTRTGPEGTLEIVHATTGIGYDHICRVLWPMTEADRLAVAPEE